MSAHELIRELEHFSTRPSAMRALRAMGKSAVPALMEAVGRVGSGARFAVLTLLGELGGTECLEVLKVATNDPDTGPVALDAVRLVCERHSLPVVSSRSLPRSSTSETREPKNIPAASLAVSPSPRSLSNESLARALADAAKAKCDRVSDQEFVFHVALPGNRNQKVFLRLDRKDMDGSDILAFYTVCAPVQEKFFKTLLKRNVEFSHCAAAIAKVNGQDMFVLVHSLVRSAADLPELLKTLATLAKRGDWVEKSLTQGDIN